jgi:hypothetical protein
VPLWEHLQDTSERMTSRSDDGVLFFIFYGIFMGQYDGISHEKTTNPIDMIFFFCFMVCLI